MSMRSLTAKLSPSSDPESVGSTSTNALPFAVPADLSGTVAPSGSRRCWPMATSTPPSQRTIALLCHRSPKGDFVLAARKRRYQTDISDAGWAHIERSGCFLGSTANADLFDKLTPSTRFDG